MGNKQKYKFSWDLIGDIADGRPNLGNQTRVEVYRLMQFTFREIIERHVGTDETEQIFYEAGKLAGKEFLRICLHRRKILMILSASYRAC